MRNRLLLGAEYDARTMTFTRPDGSVVTHDEATWQLLDGYDDQPQVDYASAFGLSNRYLKQPGLTMIPLTQRQKENLSAGGARLPSAAKITRSKIHPLYRLMMLGRLLLWRVKR